jgi:hypothetical protein
MDEVVGSIPTSSTNSPSQGVPRRLETVLSRWFPGSSSSRAVPIDSWQPSPRRVNSGVTRGFLNAPAVFVGYMDGRIDVAYVSYFCTALET